MEFHTNDEILLIETFRAAGGERIVFFHDGVPRLPRPTARALSRLIRSGHIRRHASGDFGWVSYRLRERADDAHG